MEAGTFWAVSLFVNMGNEIALCDAICSGHVIGCCRYAGEIKACPPGPLLLGNKVIGEFFK